MIKEGMTTADVAEHFGIKQQHVKLRLRLADVHPRILGAYRKGDINLETVMAFTLADSKKQQLSVFKELSPNCSAWRVRQQLTGDGVRSDGALARYVGVETYKQAGGQVVTDLFESLVYLIDGELLQRLVTEKLEQSAKRLQKREGWKVVEVNLEAAHTLNQFHRLQPDPIGVPKELSDELTVAIDARSALEDSDGDWSEEREANFDKVSDQIETLEKRIDGYREFTEDQKAKAKCVVSVGRKGKVQIDRGLVTRAQANRLSGNANDKSVGKAVTSLPNALTNDLGATRQQIAQAKLAKNPKLAGDILLLRLCQQVLGSSRWESGVIEASFDVTLSRNELLAKTTAAEDMAKTRGLLKTDWMELKSSAERLAALRNLTPSDKNRLLAFTVAACLKVGFGGAGIDKDMTEAIVADLSPEFAKKWRPTAANYFKRLTRAALLDHGKKWFGKKWLCSHENLKKGDLVSELDAFFNGKEPENLSPQQWEIRERWLPAGFGAPTKKLPK
jgi:ParB family chromosome partitioning protein